MPERGRESVTNKKELAERQAAAKLREARDKLLPQVVARLVQSRWK